MFAAYRKRFFHRSSPRRTLFRSGLEKLEDRLCLACTVSLFSSDTEQIGLLIQGDNEPDDILIQDLAPSQTGKGKQIEVHCDDQVHVFDSITLVVVRSGGGDDNISYGGFLGGTFHVDSGAGNDKLTISGTPEVVAGISADIRVNTGAGDDSTTLTTITFGGSLRLSVDAGIGNDAVSILCNGMEATASIDLLLGVGHDAATLSENTFGDSLELTIDAGAGNDAVSFRCNGALSTASIGLSLGAGHDTAMISENTFDGPLQLTIDAGAGNDAVSFLCNGARSAASIDLLLSAGDDTATLSENTFDGQTEITVDAGAGNDAVSILCNSFHSPALLGFNLGAGADTLWVQETTIADSFAILADAGAGADHVQIDGTVADGPKASVSVSVSAGAGNDTVEVEASQTGTSVAVGIDGGAGRDVISLTLASRVTVDRATAYDLRIVAGAGSDLVKVNVAEQKGWLFTLSTLVLATGAGNDRLELSTGQLSGQRPDGTTFQVFADGGTGQDTLVGPQDAAQEWRIDGLNRGRLNGNIRFVSFENLVGGDFDDTFVFLPGSRMAGQIDGGDGSDTVDYRPRGTAVVAGPPIAVNIEEVLY